MATGQSGFRMNAMPPATLTLRFLQREFRERFTGSLSGSAWAVLQPLLQLGVYSFVFVHVFKARIPGADAPGYVPFLVTALWPWTAFSEAVLRSTSVIQNNAALIGKVALPREVLVFASVCTSFAVHIAGFVAILLVLRVGSGDIAIRGLPIALLLYVPLFALALGISLACAAVQVFVRDLAQLLGQLLPLMMFGAPVFYDRALLPTAVQPWLSLNPFTFYADAFRVALLHHGSVEWQSVAIAVVVAALVLAAGIVVFRRLDAHFEDFL
jgi:lipopolysaccharide transport system permease protein